MDFSPFILCPAGERPPKPRPLDTAEGVADRLRSAAFAEFQAIHAFRWAVERFGDAPDGLREAWTGQIADEARHYDLLRGRLSELGYGLQDRPVSAALWDSLAECENAREFCLRMVNSEERGRQAALQMGRHLAAVDPRTVAILDEIAADEVVHVAVADTFYDWRP